MSSNEGLILGYGALVLLVAWLPQVLGQVALSLPIICVALGFAGFGFGFLPQQFVREASGQPLEDLLGAVLLVSLMGAGLKIDRPLGWKRWSTTWRLLGIGMPLMIGATLIGGIDGAGLALPGAFVFAGAIAPTDPVLASDVAVGPPGAGEEGEVRFGLTSEAGLNDGLAFPVVELGVALLVGQTVGLGWIVDHFVVRLLGSGLAGWAVGSALGWLTFRAPFPKLSEAGAGLVAIGATLIAYAATQRIGGYGFIAVFVAALNLRAACPDSAFNRAMEDFARQIERVLVLTILLLFGGALSGGLLDALDWRDALFCLALLLIARPVTAWLALLRSPAPAVSRATTAFFGIRGMGTFYYIIYAANHADLPEEARLRAMSGFVVLGSIIIHGLTSTPLMHKLDQIRERATKHGQATTAELLDSGE